MAKRIIIVHRWDGNPRSDWYQWLKNELEKNGFNIEIPEMPDTKHPKIEKWVSFLLKNFGDADENTYFIGHSVGCQAIIRYLEKIDKIIGGAVFVGGWFKLSDEATKKEKDMDIARPWLETKINFDNVKKHCKRFTAIFSEDDPYVTMKNADIFRENLGAKLVIVKGMGHFTEYDDVTKLQVVLDEIIKMVK